MYETLRNTQDIVCEKLLATTSDILTEDTYHTVTIYVFKHKGWTLSQSFLSINMTPKGRHVITEGLDLSNHVILPLISSDIRT